MWSLGRIPMPGQRQARRSSRSMYLKQTLHCELPRTVFFSRCCDRGYHPLYVMLYWNSSFSSEGDLTIHTARTARTLYYPNGSVMIGSNNVNSSLPVAITLWLRTTERSLSDSRCRYSSIKNSNMVLSQKAPSMNIFKTNSGETRELA